MTRFHFAVSCIMFALASSPILAHAEPSIPDNDWRQKDRTIDVLRPAQFAAELRFGPYWPQVDDEFDLPDGEGPYASTFGEDAQFYFGLEADWLPLRVPYVGMIGAGFGWGFTTTSAKAKFSDTGEESGDDTSLTIMPMHLSAVLRADELYRRTNIPIVPYVKFGVGLATWSASKTSGTSVVGEGCTEENADQTDGCAIGDGATWGLHLALGAMLSLNWLDPRASGRLYEDHDVAHIYLFGEWMNAMLDGFGSGNQMHVGTSTVIVGLAADF